MDKVDYGEIMDILNGQFNDSTAKKMKLAIKKIAIEDGIDSIRYKCERKDDQYYFINAAGEIICASDNNKNDDYRYRIGNYFKTNKEAYCYQQCLLTKQKLKDLALRLNGTTNIDTSQRFFITFDYAIDKLRQEGFFTTSPQGAVCCMDQNFLEIAIKEIGKENLINLVKSGV